MDRHKDLPASMTRHPRDVLREHGLAARKRLGQNFLLSSAALDRIVEAAGVGPQNVVLEVGTGLGNLTARLAQQAGHVVTVEVDRGLAEIAAVGLRSFTNVTLLRCDFLAGKHGINPLVTRAVRAAQADPPLPVKAVSNLPYSISSPAIVNLLEWEVEVGEMCLMLQKEVAARLTAGPGSKDYGPLTVYVNYWATAAALFSLPPQAFWPQPEVSSTLVRIVRRADRRMTEAYAAFALAVRKLFAARRKTLAHALRSAWGAQRAQEVIQELGLDPRRRPEDLSTDDFEAIARLAGPPAS
jgi:16S rRNA (adenine1518-N6/adenine1519-N6)-dimethyltransferase